ncbi:N-acetyltransferase [Halobacillus locisalis]|uniref:N-acetyltransferase n=2 Tax=Halobacillus locisalis TaxID=220753 RepID=A0A838CX72_9BACI|nr:N-acetyltransferase [Halobacillus locisalis]
MMSDIQYSEGLFYIGDKNDPSAHLAFEEENDVMQIMSTVVAPEEREQGLGTELIDHAVNYARKHKLEIDPVCSFAHEVIKETPEYHVVWKQK